MASVLAHLLSTMPIQAGLSWGMTQLAQQRYLEEQQRKKIPVSTGSRGLKTPIAVPTPAIDTTIPIEVWNAIQPVAGSWPFGTPKKPKATTPEEIDKKKGEARLWSWSHDTASANVVSNVTCRVREAGYQNHKVLSSMTFGLEKAGKVEPLVRIILDDGSTLDLPLTADALYARFAVHGGYLNGNKVSRSQEFPLEMVLDRGTVLAFAYELDEANKPRPYVPGEKDSGHAALQEWIAHWNKKAVRDDPKDRWTDRALKGDFMPLPLQSDPLLPQLRAGVDETKTVSVAPPRILVTISVSGCKERADFEPIGIVGMARIYPHLTVRATFKVRSMHASVRFKRPEKTTILLDAGESAKPQCCGATDKIGSILVSDANYGDAWFDKTIPIGPDLYFLPFWGGLFAYYLVDPHTVKDGGKALKGEALRVIDRSKGERVVKDCGTRTLAGTGQVLDVIYKVPRQGQFDNIHVAPRLDQNAPQAFMPPKRQVEFGAPGVALDIDPASMKTKDIVMAPFCSHDCFHLHWRWSTVADTKWSKGWNESGPFQVGGAPLVPPSHDLDLTIWGPNELTLTEHAAPTKDVAEDETKRIGKLREETFFYFGAAYAQGVSDYNAVSKVKLRMNVEKAGIKFITAEGKGLGCFEDPPTTYWNLRYYGRIGEGAKPEAVEWIQMKPEHVKKARKA